MGKSTPLSPSPFPDSRDRFSAPVPSDWLLFPWKLLFAYPKPPSPSSWTKTPFPSPKPSSPSHSHPQQQLRGVKSGKFWAGRCSRDGSGGRLPLLAGPVGMAVEERGRPKLSGKAGPTEERGRGRPEEKQDPAEHKAEAVSLPGRLGRGCCVKTQVTGQWGGLTLSPAPGQGWSSGARGHTGTMTF